MSDDERIARLTELARRVYGPHASVHLRTWEGGAEVWVERSWDEAPCLSAEHPRALDALEAALPVMAEEGLPHASTDMLASLQTWWAQHALALRCTSRSVHRAIGVALAALERGLPFPTMQVLADVPDDEAAHASESAWVEQLAADMDKRADRLEGERVYGKAYALRECAAELRARVKAFVIEGNGQDDVDVFESAYVAAEKAAVDASSVGVDVRELERLCTRAGINAVLHERAKGGER